MKITKEQLKQIIKEELDATMDEGHGGMYGGGYLMGADDEEEERPAPKQTRLAEPRDVFFQVIMPALESAGFSGLDAMKMAKAAVDAAFDMGSAMMGDGRFRSPLSYDRDE
tara:strand:- start:90 stop:422 length:333 start_codon:yes stop_codon:yes gene_type:complete